MGKRKKRRKKKYRIRNKRLFISVVAAGILVIFLVIFAAASIIGMLVDDKTDSEEKAVSKQTAESRETEKESKEVAEEKPDTSDILIVNKHNRLESSYVPDDLVLPESTLNGNAGRQSMTREAAEAMNNLTSAAAAEGYTIKVRSGYRSYSTQNSLFNSYAAKSGTAKAETYSARPGYSEHQTGLSADVTSPSCGYSLSYSYGETKEGIWLAENCHKYGFIIRYPEGKTDITGYVYEPWHVRYVGVEHAEKIKESGLTLEEYTGNEPAPDYE